MQGNLTLHAGFAVSDSGFSLDELAVTVKEGMSLSGMPWVMQLILELKQEALIAAIIGKRSQCPEYLDPCCDDIRYELHDTRQSKRGIRTSAGYVKVSWRSIRCRGCGKVIVPLREFLGLEPWQSRTDDLNKAVIETVADQSYRRSSAHLSTIGLLPVPKSTAHRWVAESDCEQIESDETVFEYLMADGTGFKQQSESTSEKSKKGEMRFVLGVTLEGQTVPLGIWTEENWEQIGQQLEAKEEDAPTGEYLISDGEQAIIDGLGGLADQTQRCHTHLPRGMQYVLRDDDASKDERDELTKQLCGIIEIELPEEDYDDVKTEQLDDVQARINDAKAEIDALHTTLIERGFHKAATYVGNASGHIFNFLDYWLKYGLNCPRTTNLIERLIRELGRRLKRIGACWKPEGAARMARIVITRLLSPKEWIDYWNRKMRINGRVFFMVRGVNPSGA